MIISMKLHSTKQEIEQVCERIREFGYKIHAIEGEERVVIGAVGMGDVANCLESVEAMPQVEKAVRISAPYKFVSKEYRSERSRIRLNGSEIGGDDFIVMAGPCSVESEKQIMQAAEGVAQAGAKLLRGGAFKPRTSPYDFQGLETEGLKLTITDDAFGFERNTEAIEAEGKLDGFYVIRPNLDKATLATSDVVRVYKSLSQAERAFRSIKTVDLEIRPIHHRLSDRVRAHVLLCMLAYYLEWHMRQALAPILFDDHQRAEAAAARSSIVAPAQRSKAARRKAATKRTTDGLPVHSFQSLLAELATFTRNTMAMAAAPHDTFLLYPQPTPIQLRAFELLAVQPRL